MSKNSTAAEFFAGSGLVTEGLREEFQVTWANDISEKKRDHYCSNFGSREFVLEDIATIKGKSIPKVDLVWSSFPCQDLSLAGKMAGIDGSRSGLFWDWLRVLDEMPDAPKVICLENVPGLLSSRQGKDYREIHSALVQRGYDVGPLLLDAVHWLPQSRKRVFVVAASKDLDTAEFQTSSPIWCHPGKLKELFKDPLEVVWWELSPPATESLTLSKVVDWEAPAFSKEKTTSLLSLIPERHNAMMKSIAENCDRWVFPGYRRTRNGRQTLELRFDNISGCLRTAEGGSSRQFVILWNRGEWSARLLTSREAARLMGAPDTYELSPNYNDAYSAMGDAVAVPVVEHLSKHLLSPLVKANLQPQNVNQESRVFCLKS